VVVQLDWTHRKCWGCSFHRHVLCPRPVATRPSDSHGPGMEYGYGHVPPLSSSSAFPTKVTVYNDFAMAPGTTQYLGSEVRELGPPASPISRMLTDDGGDINGKESRTMRCTSHHGRHHPLATISQVNNLRCSGRTEILMGSDLLGIADSG